jgi:hypothetical protein
VTASAVTPLAPPSVTSFQRFGFHEMPTAFVLTFSSALDPTRAQDPTNYTLRPIGSDGHLGGRIAIVSAVYNPVAHTVTLHPAKLVYLFQRYQLVVNGMRPNGVTSASGALLDGAGNGVPGSNYVRVFGRGILAGPNRPGSPRDQVQVHPSQPGHARAIRHAGPHAAHLPPAPAGHSTGVSSDAGVAGVGLNASAVDAALESVLVPPPRH